MTSPLPLVAVGTRFLSCSTFCVFLRRIVRSHSWSKSKSVVPLPARANIKLCSSCLFCSSVDVADLMIKVWRAAAPDRRKRFRPSKNTLWVGLTDDGDGWQV